MDVEKGGEGKKVVRIEAGKVCRTCDFFDDLSRTGKHTVHVVPEIMVRRTRDCFSHAA